MSVFAFWAVWVLVGVFVYRRAYVTFLDYNALAYPTLDECPEDRGFAAFVGLVSGALWPVALVAYVAWRFLTPASPRQREADLRRREARIRELERELGL